MPARAWEGPPSAPVPPMPSPSTDRNLLFGVLALQADLLDAGRFAEACAAWAARKDRPLSALLVERGWLTADDAALVERLLEKKLARFGGDAARSLAAVMPDSARRTLAGVPDADVQATLGYAAPGPRGAVLLSTQSATPGDTRDRYTTTKLHATGGLGRVWVAHDAGLNRDVALKELLPDRGGSAEAVARFLREARVTGQLEHPGIVPVYELVDDPAAASPFYTMRLIRGRTLAEAVADHHRRAAAGTATPLDRRELLAAFGTVCQAVAYAHSRRVIHRDLKPANIVLGDFGEVIVLDWGIARVLDEPEADDPQATVAATPPVRSAAGDAGATRHGQVLGTPGYMAPEQASGAVDRIDERTDVYGLGAVLYEILAGRVPFRGETVDEVLRQVREVAPPPPSGVARDVPKPLEAVALKCLAKNPADRYPGPKAVAADVAHFLADEPVTAYRDPPRVRLARWSRRHRTLVGGAGLAVLIALPVLLVSLVLVAGSEGREKAARQAADKARDEAEENFRKAARATELVSEELARGIKPLTGTRSKTVAEILARAEAVYDDLLAGPHPPARVRLNKARLLVLVSDVYRTMSQPAVAKERAGRAAELCRGLLADAADDADARLTLAAAHHRTGWALSETGALTAAVAELAEAVRLFDAAGVTAEARPEDAFALAGSLTLSGNAHVDTADYPAAKPLHERGLALREALYARAPTPAAAVQLATSCERTGMYMNATGDRPGALANLRRAVELNRTASTSDRGNQEFAAAYIRSLNSLAEVELEAVPDREAALGRLRTATELAEAFARRDPDNDDWQRERVRNRWVLTEVDKKYWGRLDEAERREARERLIAILREIEALAERRLAGGADNGLWLADRGNVRGRLADEYLALADAGADPDANRATALKLANQSVVDYDAVLAVEPRSYTQRVSWLFSLRVAARAAAKAKPDAAALARHWGHLREALRTHMSLYRVHPENPKWGIELRRLLFFNAPVPAAFGDRWPPLFADPAVMAAFLDCVDLLPTPAAVTDPDLSKAVAAAREVFAMRLAKVAAAGVTLPPRAEAARAALAGK